MSTRRDNRGSFLNGLTVKDRSRDTAQRELGRQGGGRHHRREEANDVHFGRRRRRGEEKKRYPARTRTQPRLPSEQTALGYHPVHNRPPAARPPAPSKKNRGDVSLLLQRPFFVKFPSFVSHD